LVNLRLLSCVCGACWAGQPNQTKKQGETTVGEQVGRLARGGERSQGSASGKGAGQSSQRKKGGEQDDAAIHVLSSEPRLNVA
jgi:hypothetical protein